MQKIIFTVLIAAVFCLQPCGTAFASDLTVKLNGQEVYFPSKPVIIDGRTLVPMRRTCEILGIELYWDSDTQTAYMTRRGTLAYHRAETNIININETELSFDVSSRIIDNRIFMPLGMLSAILDAEITYSQESRTVNIRYYYGSYKLTVNGKTVGIGQTADQMKYFFGEPDSVLPSQYSFDWYVYDSEPENFVMIGIDSGLVRAFYTNAESFTLGDVSYGSVGAQDTENITYFKDSLNGGRIYGVFVNTSIYSSDRHIQEFDEIAEGEAILIKDMTNAFRRNNGVSALTLDEDISGVARTHASDMAARNYFSHTSPEGKTVADRLVDGNVFFSLCSENLAAGNNNAMMTFDQWVNSKLHRENLLRRDCEYIGCGSAYNQKSTNKYYYCQIFVKK